MSDSTLAGRPTAVEAARDGAFSSPHSPEAAITTTGAPRTPPQRLSSKRRRRAGDAVFRGLATGSGVFIIVLIAAIATFLLVKAVPSLTENQVNFLTSRAWSTADPDNLRFGITDLLWVTVASAAFALLIAMPLALGISLFLTHYAPKSISRSCAYLIDLLAAVPSVVFGLWGIKVLAPALSPLTTWLNTNLGWFPLFAEGNVSLGANGNIFMAGVVLAVMILPIITAVSREVFSRTPVTQIEGALALGATKWEMIRTTVWPFGKAGYVSGTMLGLGRALGETIAVLLILSTSNEAPGFSLFDGGYTIASKIASASSEFSSPKSTGAYIAIGLVLFLLTFVVNALARWVVAGKKES